MSKHRVPWSTLLANKPVYFGHMIRGERGLEPMETPMRALIAALVMSVPLTALAQQTREKPAAEKSELELVFVILAGEEASLKPQDGGLVFATQSPQVTSKLTLIRAGECRYELVNTTVAEASPGETIHHSMKLTADFSKPVQTRFETAAAGDISVRFRGAPGTIRNAGEAFVTRFGEKRDVSRVDETEAEFKVELPDQNIETAKAHYALAVQAFATRFCPGLSMAK